MALFKAQMPADSAPPIAQGKGWANLLKGSAPVLKKGEKLQFFLSRVNGFQARAPRALGLLLADGAPTVGEGKTF